MDSAEHEECVGALSAETREVGEQDGADLLERILSRDNLNRAYKRVRANHGAPGIDGMTIEDALPWLREHREELLESIKQGKYKPQPVRRKEIPKPDGGVRKLGIPNVVDCVIQQAIAQQLTPIYESLFSDGSYGYRPGRSAQQAIRKVKEYAEQGYTQAVLVDLTKYFDTLNHELLMNLFRKNTHDKRVTELIKRYLKSGVMEYGIRMKTEEGSPQGGPNRALLDYLVPENRTARAILTNDVHFGEAANAIFAETFKVFSVIWGKDVDRDSVKKLLGIYKDSLRTTGELEFQERHENSLKQGLGRIDYFCKGLLNLAKHSYGWKKVRCLRRYVELKACYWALEARDASVAEKFIQLVLDSWDDVRSLPIFLCVATSLIELLPVSDVSDNLIASLVGLCIASHSWPEPLPGAYAPENLKALL